MIKLLNILNILNMPVTFVTAFLDLKEDRSNDKSIIYN